MSKPPPPIHHRGERWLLIGSLLVLAGLAAWLILHGH